MAIIMERVRYPHQIKISEYQYAVHFTVDLWFTNWYCRRLFRSSGVSRFVSTLRLKFKQIIIIILKSNRSIWKIIVFFTWLIDFNCMSTRGVFFFFFFFFLFCDPPGLQSSIIWQVLFLSFLLIIIRSLLRVFPTSISRWFLTGVGVTASLLKSIGHFSVLWSISVML